MERIRNSPRILGFPKGDQIAAVGRTFGRSLKWVNDYLGLARLDPGLRRLLEPGVKKKARPPLALAFRIASLPREQQLPEWERIRRKKLSARQANRHLDKTILRKGLGKNRRGAKPSDDVGLLVRLLQRLERDASDVLALNNTEFTEMVASRNKESRAHILDELAMAQQSLGRIAQRFRDTAAATPAK